MGYRLLLADDSITIQKVVELVLAGEGFDIKAASNGDEALSVLPSFKPDVILADIAMPVMNGYQLCEKIKSNPETRDVPVILMAGAFEPIDEELAKRVGADDYIVKPFESQELISKLNAVFENPVTSEVSGAGAEEAEPFEALAADEDLLTMEDTTLAEVAEEAEPAETLLEKEISFEEAFASVKTVETGGGPEKEVLEEALEVITMMEEGVIEEVAPRAEITPAPEPAIAPSVQPRFVQPEVVQPQVEVPSREEVAAMLRKNLDENISSLISASDIKDSFRASIDKRVDSLLSAPDIKDSLFETINLSIRYSAEKIFSEIAPQVIERLLRETLNGVAASLAKEAEKVIWETVPDLAETVITREIEKIKSEI